MVPFCTIPVVGTVVALLSAGISAVLEQVMVLTCIPRWVRAAPGRLQIPLPFEPRELGLRGGVEVMGGGREADKQRVKKAPKLLC